MLRLIAILLLVSGCSAIDTKPPDHPLMVCVSGIDRETGRPILACVPVVEVKKGNNL